MTNDTNILDLELEDEILAAALPAAAIDGIPATGGGLTGAFYAFAQSLRTISDLKALIEERDEAGGPDGAFRAESIDFAGGATIAQFLESSAVIDPASAPAANVAMNLVGMTFAGFIYIPAGRHEITVRSDDGFELLLNGEVYSSHEDIRSERATSKSANFEGGLYEVELSYFDYFHSQSLKLEIDGHVVGQSAFYESVAQFEAAVDEAGAELTPTSDYHPSSPFGSTAFAPEPAISFDDLEAAPLTGTGLSGALYDTGAILSITEFGLLIDAGVAPVADFTSTRLSYGGVAPDATVAEFLGEDGASLSAASDMTMDGVGMIFSGYVLLPAGEHTLTVRSDDGFALFLGGAEVARYDTTRGARDTSVTDVFEGGLYKFELAYFEKTDHQTLSFEVDGLPIDGSAFYQSIADFALQLASPDVVKLPIEDYHPGQILGPEAYGEAVEETGDATPNHIEGAGGDDELAGGEDVDHITGGYGDDKLEGGAGDDVLDGERGSDLLLGGDGDDLLIARSDAGEQRIGQLAVNAQTRGDPDGEVNDDRQKLYGWESQPKKADDILVGGEGRDTFLIAPQINAKQDIIEKHVRKDGTINWAGVAGENDEVHDHWVDMTGIDVIADYVAGEDHIAIIGHTAVPEIQAIRDVDGDGDLETIIAIYSRQHGGGGAHDRDLIGQLIVHGDLVDIEAIQTDGNVTYGIVESYEDIAEALFPAGPAKDTVTIAQSGGFIDAGTGAQDPGNPLIEAAYDTRTFNVATNEVDLGAVTGTPEAHIDNPYLSMLADLDGPPSTPGFQNSRAPFEPIQIVQRDVDESLPIAVALWRFDDAADGVAADAFGGPDAIAYRLYENQALPRLNGADDRGPTDEENVAISGASERALTFDGERDFAFIQHHAAHQISQGTIALWARPDDLSERQTLVSKDLRGSGEGGHFHLGHDDDGRIVLRMAEGDGDGNKSWISATSVLEEGVWSHIAVTFTEDGVTVYVDGVDIPDYAWVRREGAVDSPGDYTEAYFIQNQEPWVLGADTSGTRISGTAAAFATDDDRLDDAFEGAIADFGIWGGFTPEAALDADQVYTLFEEGPGAIATGEGGVMDGRSVEETGDSGRDILEGAAGDDVLEGAGGRDELSGGYGDDHLKGGAGDDVLEGGRGSDLLQGGAGDDVLVSRSDVGEQRIGQFAVGEPTRGDPDMEVNPAYQKLYGWEDQPSIGDDVLVGGAGADTFLFNPLINAKLDIILEHVRDDRSINWAGVAGENDEAHDHWVDAFGIDIIADFVADEDEIVIIGHTVAPEVRYKLIDGDDDGRPDDLVSIITVYSRQHGGGGAHDKDLIGQIVVYGDAVDPGAIVSDAGVTHGIVRTVDEIIEAVAPNPGPLGRKDTGVISQIDPLTGRQVEVYTGYDSRSYSIGTSEDIVVTLGDVVTNPDDHYENPFAGAIEFASAARSAATAAEVLLNQGGASFDETTRYVNIADTAGLGQSAGTILASFTARSPGEGYQALWSQDASGYGGGGHNTAWIDTDGRIKVRFQSDDESFYLRTKSEVRADETYTVALTFEDGEARLYLDGVLEDTEEAPETGTFGNEESIVLGASAINRTSGEVNKLRDFFDGEIENFAILDAPLSLADLILEREAGGLTHERIILDAGPDAETLAGGAGLDTVNYANSSAGVRVDLGANMAEGGDAEGDQLISVEDVIGSGFNDELIGDARANRLIGGDGYDRLDGGGGDDLLEGGAGNDIYVVRDAGDVVVEREGEGDGDRANIYVDFESPGGIEYIVGMHAAAGLSVTGSDAGEQIIGANRVDDGDDLNGGAGDDRIVGLTGDDFIFGGEGDDRIFGNAGDDVIAGGAGADRVTGQLGADVFVHAPGDGLDWITDFDPTVDRLDLIGHEFASFDDVLARLSDGGGGAFLDLGDDEGLIFIGVAANAISEQAAIL